MGPAPAPVDEKPACLWEDPGQAGLKTSLPKASIPAVWQLLLKAAFQQCSNSTQQAGLLPQGRAQGDVWTRKKDVQKVKNAKTDSNICRLPLYTVTIINIQCLEYKST